MRPNAKLPAVQPFDKAAQVSNPCRQIRANGSINQQSKADRPQPLTPISRKFLELRARNELALIAYVTLGDPDLETSSRIIRSVFDAGADIVELGLPFSDPVADGPVLQESSLRALAHAYKIDRFFDMIKNLGPVPGPMLIMTYCNPVFQYGLEKFLKRSLGAGVSGFILSDLPPEEAGEYKRLAGAMGLDTIFLAAPTSTPDRLRAIAAASTGFLYCVSRAGTTGARSSLDPGLKPFLNRVRKLSDQPLAVGFGISDPDQVRSLRGLAQGAVVGSAIAVVLARNLGKSKPEKAVYEFVKSLKSGCK